LPGFLNRPVTLSPIGTIIFTLSVLKFRNMFSIFGVNEQTLTHYEVQGNLYS